MKYEDFVIRIEEKSGDDFKVSIDSPAGSGQSRMSLPFDSDQMARMLRDLSDTFRGSGKVAAIAVEEVGGDGGTTREMERETAVPPGKSTDLGQQLFEHLLTGDARTLFNRSVGRVQSDDGLGLRIKLQLNTKDPDVAKLASLPWELIWSPEEHEYLNLIGKYPMVRHLAITQPDDKEPISLPLRILVVMANPKGVAALNLDHERKLIQDNWATHDNVLVDFLDKATIEELDKRLVENEYHVLHYMGHGDFDQESGLGMLILEDDDGEAVPCRADTLSVVLRKARKMRLVVLNACDTGKAGKVVGQDPFAGVASALVMANVGDVVAMQFPISDKAAVKFAEKFYWSLATGFPVVAAVSEGRTAIKLARPNSMEWATPVLFMRSASDPFFSPEQIKPLTQEDKSGIPQDPKIEPDPTGGNGSAPPKPNLRRLALLVGLPLVAVAVALIAWQLMGSQPPLESIAWGNTIGSVDIVMDVPEVGGAEVSHALLPLKFMSCDKGDAPNCTATSLVTEPDRLLAYNINWEPSLAGVGFTVKDDSMFNAIRHVYIGGATLPGTVTLTGTVADQTSLDPITVVVNVGVPRVMEREASLRADSVLAFTNSPNISNKDIAASMQVVLDKYAMALSLPTLAAKTDKIVATRNALIRLADDSRQRGKGASELTIIERKNALESWIAAEDSFRTSGSPARVISEDSLKTIEGRIKNEVTLTTTGKGILTCTSVSNNECKGGIATSFPTDTSVDYSVEFMNVSNGRQSIYLRLFKDGKETPEKSEVFSSGRSSAPRHAWASWGPLKTGSYTIRAYNKSEDLLGTHQFHIR